MNTRQLLEAINAEDHKVPMAVAAALPQIEALAEAVYTRMKQEVGCFTWGPAPAVVWG